MNRQAIAAGSALLACSLASLAHGQSALFSSLSGFSQSATLGPGTVTDTGTFGTPVDTLFSTATNDGTASFLAFYSTGVYDTFYLTAYRSDPFNGGFMTGFATINLLATASIGGLIDTDASFTWQIDSVTVNVGDVFTAGTYTLSWSGTQVGTTASFAGQIFFAGPAAAIPLPSAAGLAAIGLAGLGRRRRR
jgi:hypothetical protein